MPATVDDIVASVEDAVRRAYALGRSDAMKRVVELAQSDDPGLRAVALLGPAEPARPEQLQAVQHDPAETEAVVHEQAAEHADTQHEARVAETMPQHPAPSLAPARETTARKAPKSVGGFLADYFYPLGSKKR